MKRPLKTPCEHETEPASGNRRDLCKGLSEFIESTVNVYCALQGTTTGLGRANPRELSDELESLARTVVQWICSTPPGEWGSEITAATIKFRVNVIANTIGISFSEMETDQIVFGDGELDGSNRDDSEEPQEPDIPF